MHPAIFLAGWLLLGELFALQDYAMARSWSHHPRIGLLAAGEGFHFLLWGTICLIVWWSLQRLIQQGTTWEILIRLVPLSIVVGVLEEAAWAAAFPHGISPDSRLTYWQTFKYCVNGELIDNLVIFWVAISFFRGIGYYQRLREKEYAAMRMESELTNAQLQALRMQLNPHFLFNTLNSVSSLMRSDVQAADRMLEGMSSMLRMSLERGNTKLIPLTEEVEFVELYLSIQKMRFQGTVHHYIAIDPDVLATQVPAMILQPIVENAYIHGVARTVGEAFLGVEAQSQNGQLRLCVRNSGRGIERTSPEKKSVGIANVRARLELQYGQAQTFSLNEFTNGEVQAVLLLPLEFELNSRRSSLEMPAAS